MRTKPDQRAAPACSEPDSEVAVPETAPDDQDGVGELSGADIFIRVRRKRSVRLPASLRQGRHRAPVGRRSAGAIFDLRERSERPSAWQIDVSGQDPDPSSDVDVAV